MKVLAINSSARKDGNTALLIDTVFEELKKEGIETEMVQLAGKVIEPCKACWACGGKKNCAHKKDRFQEIYEKMIQADGILLGSPVYTANISANTRRRAVRNNRGSVGKCRLRLPGSRAPLPQNAEPLRGRDPDRHARWKLF